MRIVMVGGDVMERRRFPTPLMAESSAASVTGGESADTADVTDVTDAMEAPIFVVTLRSLFSHGRVCAQYVREG